MFWFGTRGREKEENLGYDFEIGGESSKKNTINPMLIYKNAGFSELV